MNTFNLLWHDTLKTAGFGFIDSVDLLFARASIQGIITPLNREKLAGTVEVLIGNSINNQIALINNED